MRYTLGLGVGRWRQCTGHRAVSAPGATAMVLHLNPRLESGQLDQLDQLDRAQQLTLSPPRSKAGHLQQPAEPGHSDLRISIDLGPCLGTSSPSPPRTATSLLNTRQEQEKGQGRCRLLSGPKLLMTVSQSVLPSPLHFGYVGIHHRNRWTFQSNRLQYFKKPR